MRRFLQLADDTERVLDQNWEKVERIADAMLEKMKISCEELEKIFKEEVAPLPTLAA